MTRARVLVAIVVALAVAALVAACGSGDAQRPAAGEPLALSAAQQRALELRVRTLVPNVTATALGYEVRWGAPRASTRALVDGARREIWLFARRGDAPHRVAHDLAHELGHAYDQQRMTDVARRTYLERRGRPSAPWWPGAGDRGYAAGADDFAEVFALCHAASPEFRSRMASRPDAPCALLPRDAAGDLTKRTTT